MRTVSPEREGLKPEFPDYSVDASNLGFQREVSPVALGETAAVLVAADD
jgi:hypothetical protein